MLAYSVTCIGSDVFFNVFFKAIRSNWRRKGEGKEGDRGRERRAKGVREEG